MKKHHVNHVELTSSSGEIIARYKKSGEPWKFNKKVEPVNIIKYEIKNKSYGTIGIIWGRGLYSGKVFKIYLKKSKNGINVVDYSICE